MGVNVGAGIKKCGEDGGIRQAGRREKKISGSEGRDQKEIKERKKNTHAAQKGEGHVKVCPSPSFFRSERLGSCFAFCFQ